MTAPVSGHKLRIVDVPLEPPVGTVIEYDDRVITRIAKDDDTYPRRDWQDDAECWHEGGAGPAGAWWTWGDVISQAIHQATGGRYVERRPFIPDSRPAMREEGP